MKVGASAPAFYPAFLGTAMLTITEKILSGIKEAYDKGEKVTIDLKEASSLTGSGSGVGGRVLFDDAFATLRYANPFRMGSRNVKISESDMQFVAKTGNAANQTNPWGYPVQNNTGTPGTNTSIWQLPVRAVTAQLPIRTAVFSDVNGLQSELVEDLMLEFAQIEGASMAVNDDQAGSTTTSTGATSGLRGLDSYATGSTAAYGTSGTSITSGIHTLATVAQTVGGVTYDNIAAVVNAFPSQYWAMPGNAWHISPAMIESLRSLKDSQGLPLFLEMGDEDAAAVGRMFGFPVIPNPYLSTDFPIYLANWPRFLTIADNEEMSIQMFDQTTPGFVTIYAEKRVVSSVRDPFAGVRMSA
jgi:HK97 family phage major capsid protein